MGVRVVGVRVVGVRVVGVRVVGVDVKFGPRDVLALCALEVNVDLIFEAKGCDRILKNRLLHTEVAKGSDGHVAADS